MKATLEFNLPDDELDYDKAVNGGKWSLAMWEMDNWLRANTKHAPDTMSDDTFTAFEQSRDKLHEILQEYSLKL
jgi:hypothetical protein